MCLRTAIIIIALFVTAPQSAKSEFFDGNELYRQCRDTNGIGISICSGYVLGIYDAIDGAQNIENGRKVICAGTNVSGLQVRDVVFKYLVENPSIRHYAAYVLTKIAIIQSFHCPG